MELQIKLLRERKIKILYTFFAAFFTFLANFLPDFMNVVGIAGAGISAVTIWGPMNGMILGPFYGALASMIGVFAYLLLKPDLALFDYLSLVLLVFSSVIAGLLIVKREKIAIGVYSFFIVAWYFFETGRQAFTTPWLHMIALLAFILFRRAIREPLFQVDLYTFTYLFLISLVATLWSHIAGNILALIFFNLSPEMYNSVVFIYPVERLILAFLAAVVTFFVVAVIHHTIVLARTVEDDLKQMETVSLLKYVNEDVRKVLEEDEKK